MNTQQVLKSIAFVAFGSIMALTSCKKKAEDPAPATTINTTSYTDGPVGATSVLKSGVIVQQNAPATPTTNGGVEIIKDVNGNEFVHLKSDFVSGFSTGTVVVYLAKANSKIGDQRSGGTTPTNVKAVGFVNANGEKYLKINGSSSGYAFIVLYCETAEVNFGSATL